MEWFYQEFAKAVAQSRDTTEKLGAPQKLAIIARGKNYDFIPREIQLYIENTMEQTYLWEFRVAARHIKLYISVARGEVAPAHEATKVAEWLNIAATAAPAECSAEMDIYIYLTDLKKELPTRADGGAVREKHANTAFTTSCRKNTEIHLFRREEWLKVFIHETFHAMGLDFSADGVGAHAAARRIGALFSVRAEDVCLYEAYTETMAELCVAALVSPRKIAAYVRAQEKFAVFQMCKILTEIWGTDYAGAFKPVSPPRTEKTPILSYYIIKTILWVNLPEFLEWCRVHNTNFLRFHHKKIPQFCDFIERAAHGEKIRVAATNGARIYIKKCRGTRAARRKPLCRTLRMVGNLRFPVGELIVPPLPPPFFGWIYKTIYQNPT